MLAVFLFGSLRMALVKEYFNDPDDAKNHAEMVERLLLTDKPMGEKRQFNRSYMGTIANELNQCEDHQIFEDPWLQFSAASVLVRWQNCQIKQQHNKNNRAS